MTTTKNGTRNVKIITRTVGRYAGTVGILRCARSGRKLAETPDTYPLDFTTAARRGAAELAAKRGWTVVE